MATQTLTTELDAPKASSALWRVVFLIAASVIINSFVHTFSGEKSRFLLKYALHLNTSEQATFAIIAAIPGYLRPFMGAGSDLFPLFGFHRRSYYALSWLIMAAGYLALGSLSQYRYGAVVGLIIVAVAGGNILFVIMDAVMVAIGNRYGQVGRLQAVQQALPLILSLFTGPLGGYFTQHWSYHWCFAAAGITALLGIPVTLLIDEQRVDEKVPQNVDENHAARVAARAEERTRNQEALKKAAKSPGLWAVVGFVFYLILTPGTNLAQFNYERDVLHFSAQLIGNLDVPGAIGAMAGGTLYVIFSPRLPVRAIVWCAFFMDCVIYLICMGLHDYHSAMVVIFLLNFSGAFYGLSLLTLAARATPPGIEGTIYGLVISAQTLAGTLGDKLGSSIYDYFGPASHHSITHGWFSLLWFGFAFTAIAFVFIPFLPAWAKSNEPLRPEPEAATAS